VPLRIELRRSEVSDLGAVCLRWNNRKLCGYDLILRVHTGARLKKERGRPDRQGKWLCIIHFEKATACETMPQGLPFPTTPLPIRHLRAFQFG
jgi:hypothetical protein